MLIEELINYMKSLQILPNTKRKMVQKFRTFTTVKVSARNLPLDHREEFYGIIKGTDTSINSSSGSILYSVAVLNEDKSRVVNSIAWINEFDITPTKKQNRLNAESMIEQFNLVW